MPTSVKEYKPRRVRSEEDRQQFSSEYIQLAEGEKFVGYAMFEGDPKKDEPGYFEYMEHYDPSLGKRGGSVPCAEEGCPYCEDGDRPRSRAKTLWLVTQIGDKKLKTPELRIFNMSSISIGVMTEMRNEGDEIHGRAFRVSRVDEKNYLYTPKDAKLKKGEIKEHLKNAPDFEKLLTAQGKKIIEKLTMQRVMDDTDDDPEPRSNGKVKGKKEEEPDDPESDGEMPDEAEDETVTILKVNKKENTLQVEHENYGEFKLWGTEAIDLSELDKGDSIVVAWEKDDEEDYVIQAEPEAAEAEANGNDAELPDEIEDEVFVITDTDSDNETMEVENDELGLTFTLYFLDTLQIDFDDFPAGSKIKVSAEKDTQGDMVASSVPELVKDKKATGGKKGGRKTAAK